MLGYNNDNYEKMALFKLVQVATRVVEFPQNWKLMAPHCGNFDALSRSVNALPNEMLRATFLQHVLTRVVVILVAVGWFNGGPGLCFHLLDASCVSVSGG